MSKFQPSCSYCKRRGNIVHRVRGMNYCHDCKDKAPTKLQFDEYINSNVEMNCKTAPLIRPKSNSGRWKGH
jgi:hypothetical protein